MGHLAVRVWVWSFRVWSAGPPFYRGPTLNPNPNPLGNLAEREAAGREGATAGEPLADGSGGTVTDPDRRHGESGDTSTNPMSPARWRATRCTVR